MARQSAWPNRGLQEAHPTIISDSPSHRFLWAYESGRAGDVYGSCQSNTAHTPKSYMASESPPPPHTHTNRCQMCDSGFPDPMLSLQYPH